LKNFIRHKLGIDRAIGATTANNLLRFLTGPISMLLVIQFLDAETQGYIYSFGAVIGIQTFLELGFAASIVQFTAKEFANLRFTSRGLLTGSPESLSRLRSIFQKANKYYSLMAFSLAVVLIAGGHWFFSSKPDHGVPWQTPWLIICICTALNFVLNPFWALLEGCGKVADVALFRTYLTFLTFLLSCISLIVTKNIYAVIWPNVLVLFFTLAYIFIKWRNILLQILRPFQKRWQVNWRRELWGFQWRVGGAWIGRYVLEVGLPAIAFQVYGPIAAGQVGMSFQLSRTVSGISTSWTATKIPHWGALTARNAYSELSHSWRKAAKLHILIAFVGQFALLFAVFLFYIIMPEKAQRLLSIQNFFGLTLGWIIAAFWFVEVHYTRAFRIEPFVIANFLASISFLLIVFLFHTYFGVATITYAFALVHIPLAWKGWAIVRSLPKSTPDACC
jgi:O-antigen/teichoic acid export membrane protein